VGIASTEDKRRAAREAGADHVVATDDWVRAVKSATGGRGADVVYDSVGATLRDSLDAARIGGTVVFYGMAAGDPAPVDPRLLMDRSLALVGGDLWNVLTTAHERRTRAAELFGWIDAGVVKVRVSRTHALRDGAAAHRELEGRQVVGKIVLLP
jgi:NADPH2:quinone reductase